MTASPALVIESFRPADQAEVKRLILAGLAEHWGALDPAKNPDLNDIASTYADSVFLVARQDGRIIGTGALVPRDDGTAEIVRMSVAKDARRSGVGRAVLRALCARAAAREFGRVVLETTETWGEVIAFYLANGFQVTHRRGGDVYFALDLALSAVEGPASEAG
ncbi:MAG: putative acetyltransferase [Anaerolineaceae bacterium]|nr:MAG: putative acetyltransferase [Anaerolineaceae bacterium]